MNHDVFAAITDDSGSEARSAPEQLLDDEPDEPEEDDDDEPDELEVSSESDASVELELSESELDWADSDAASESDEGVPARS